MPNGWQNRAIYRVRKGNNKVTKWLGVLAKSYKMRRVKMSACAKIILKISVKLLFQVSPIKQVPTLCWKVICKSHTAFAK